MEDADATPAPAELAPDAAASSGNETAPATEVPAGMEATLKGEKPPPGEDPRRRGPEDPLVAAKVPESPKPSSADTLTREQVKSVMDGLAPSVKRCVTGAKGRVVVKIAVSGETGRVIDAVPLEGSAYDGTPVGLCAARVVTLAKFPKFDSGQIIIKYPFDL